MLLSELIRLVPYVNMLSEDMYDLIPTLNVSVRQASFEEQENEYLEYQVGIDGFGDSTCSGASLGTLTGCAWKPFWDAVES